MGEKTEKATPKKLRDARKKGQVAKSQDIPGAATFVTSLGLLLALSTFLFEQFTGVCFFFWGRISSPTFAAKIKGFIVKNGNSFKAFLSSVVHSTERRATPSSKQTTQRRRSSCVREISGSCIALPLRRCKDS
nr:EscU/YscU/HrcU family type III secretion system export apparatus switch protein [Candidatus Similichlamydia epinepheli]